MRAVRHMQSVGVWGASAAVPDDVQRFLDHSTSADICHGQVLQSRKGKSSLIPDSLGVLCHLASAAAFRTRYKTLLPIGLIVPAQANHSPKDAVLDTCLWELLHGEGALVAVNEQPQCALPQVSDKAEALHTVLAELGPLSLKPQSRRRKQTLISQQLNVAPRQVANGTVYTWAHFKVRVRCMLPVWYVGHDSASVGPTCDDLCAFASRGDKL